MKQGLLVVAILAAGASSARADEIVLANGRKIANARAVESKDPNKVIFDVGGGRIELDKKMVSAVNPGRTALHDYEDKAKAVQNSTRASDFWDLAQWCKQNKLPRYVGPLCERVVKLDAAHDAAHRELGHERIEGKWLTRDQVMEKKGFKKVGDQWLTKAEVELQEKRRLEAKERELAQKAEREARKAEERDRRQRMAEEAADWYARQVADLDGYFYQPSEFWPAYFRPYPWASYLRSRRNFQYGSPGGYYGGGATLDLWRLIPTPFLKK